MNLRCVYLFFFHTYQKVIEVVVPNYLARKKKTLMGKRYEIFVPLSGTEGGPPFGSMSPLLWILPP